MTVLIATSVVISDATNLTVDETDSVVKDDKDYGNDYTKNVSGRLHDDRR